MARKRTMAAGGIFGAPMSTAILQYPSGRYGIAGSIPMALTVEDTRSLSPGARKSMVWQAEQDVIDALLDIGITRFQRADCSWYTIPE